MIIQIIGLGCSLSNALLVRLLHAGCHLSVMNPDFYRKKYNTILRYTEAKLTTLPGDFSISFDNSSADIVIGKNIKIIDLIPSQFDEKWLHPCMLTWVDKDKDPIEDLNWWLSETDAVDGLARLCLAKIRPDSVVMCGRKSWKSSDAKIEFDMLWNRTISGQSGTFSLADLELKPLTGIGVETALKNDKKRPNLKPLHDFLLEADGEGWRPKVPLRTSLMIFIAGVMETQN